MDALSKPFDLPWHDVNSFFRRRFGGKVGKILLHTGQECPHRFGTGGCIFCHDVSILPAGIRTVPPITDQIQAGRAALAARYPAGRFVAYFQSGTNTAAPLPQLREWWETALACREIVALAVGTRPDYLSDGVVALLAEMASRKPVFIDLGLQSVHEPTLSRIRRGHTFQTFQDAIQRLALVPGVLPIAHLILGLPGEDRPMMLETFRRIGRLPLHGVKIHHLQIVRGTPLEEEYGRERFPLLGPEEYVQLLADGLELVPPAMVIHRLSGDQPREYLLAPMWAWDKTRLIRALAAEFRRRQANQGSRFEP